MSIFSILKDIFFYYFRPGPYWLLFTYVVTAIAVAAIVFYGRRRNKSVGWMVCMSLLIFYSVTVITSTILSRPIEAAREVNTDLFWSWRRALLGIPHGILMVVENILLLMPVTFLLPFINKERFRAVPTIFLGFLFSLGIEVSQFVFCKGLFELDDLVNNTIGVVIGYVLARMVLRGREACFCRQAKK